ncbi:hypothetical protein CK203_098639 [Vitis vinifera]|uniref:Uncharacterized protein n=1 Tax=Vitis vinifera TaxID=29760 RepID=A0A438CMF0_VITVI|nr:hypothetical protein CK203_098639 [Vitis vinifera]
MPARQPTSFTTMVAYFLNPRFQYKPRFGNDLKLLQAVHGVFARLDLVVEALGQFANEVENDEVVEKDYLDLLNILTEVVYSESFNKDTEDSFQVVVNFQPSIDSTSARQSSKPSVVGTSTSGYDSSRGEIDDKVGNVGGDVRRVGPYIEAIGKSYRGRG